MLDDDRDYELWLIQWRPADKPGVMAQLGRELVSVNSFHQPDNLSRAGFARHRKSRDPSSSAGGAVYDLDQSLFDERQVKRVDF